MILIADSGSTKTDWCLADRGVIVSRKDTQGINPFHQDEDEINRIIIEELLPVLVMLRLMRSFSTDQVAGPRRYYRCIICCRIYFHIQMLKLIVTLLLRQGLSVEEMQE